MEKEFKYNMNRIRNIIDNSLFKECLLQIEECEKDRVFCRHGLVHLLDVARIAYILDLEKAVRIDKEMIYAAALLHDIGRHEQYLNGIDHDEAGALIAQKILTECGFCEDERETIVSAIREHRSKTMVSDIKNDLRNIIKEADRLSRACYACESIKECKWSDEKKNYYPAY